VVGSSPRGLLPIVSAKPRPDGRCCSPMVPPTLEIVLQGLHDLIVPMPRATLTKRASQIEKRGRRTSRPGPPKIGALEKSAVRVMRKLYEATGGRRSAAVMGSAQRKGLARRFGVHSGALKITCRAVCRDGNIAYCDVGQARRGKVRPLHCPIGEFVHDRTRFLLVVCRVRGIRDCACASSLGIRAPRSSKA